MLPWNINKVFFHKQLMDDYISRKQQMIICSIGISPYHSDLAQLSLANVVGINGISQAILC